jgi:phosphoketolase
MSAQVEEVLSEPAVAGSFALAIVQGRETVFDCNAFSEIDSAVFGASLSPQLNEEFFLRV